MSKTHSTKYEGSQTRSYTDLKLSETNNAKEKQSYNNPTRTNVISHTKMYVNIRFKLQKLMRCRQTTGNN